jgi:hypothetical protein
MRRYLDALHAVESAVNLSALISLLGAAVSEAEAEGIEANQDAAVLVLGALVAFHTQTDIISLGGYEQLLDVCKIKIEERNMQ